MVLFGAEGDAKHAPGPTLLIIMSQRVGDIFPARKYFERLSMTVDTEYPEVDHRGRRFKFGERVKVSFPKAPSVTTMVLRSYTHEQVPTLRNDVRVDILIKPLIEALWRQGFVTQYSCQGEPELWPDRTGKAYIAFAQRHQAADFWDVTADHLNVDAQDLMEVSLVPMTNGRGAASFPPLLLDKVTKIWAK